MISGVVLGFEIFDDFTLPVSHPRHCGVIALMYRELRSFRCLELYIVEFCLYPLGFRQLEGG